MNDLHHPCESWAERISLAAAGCTSPDEEREIRQHIETCSGCRERFRELTALCGTLAEAQLPTNNVETAIVAQVMTAVASDASQLGPLSLWERARVRAKIIPAFLPRSPVNSRWIMRSPVFRVAAAVIFILAITGAALWFHDAGTTYAFADFIKPILEAKTVKYKETVTWTSLPAGQKGLPAEMQKNMLKGLTSEVMMLGANRKRQVSELADKSKTVFIWDGVQGKSISLIPAQMRATVLNDAHKHKTKTPNGGDPVSGWRSLLLDAKDKPDVKRESLGEKEIDGRRVVGFRISSPDSVFCVWGDPKTGLPARIEMTTPILPDIKLTVSDFEFNVDLDESLFSVEPPAGYEVTSIRSPKTDDTPASEKDLIETFRYYGELSGGAFPDLLDCETLTEMIYGGLWVFNSLDHSPTSSEEKHTEEHYAAQVKFDRGLRFAVLLPKESDSHYAGKDVLLGTADTPIFWYRPKDAKKYRVIYADLSVREAKTPPSMPVAQPGQSENDLIKILREYSEWSGGALPDALDETELIGVFRMKNILADVPEKQDKRSSEQWKKIAGAHFKFLRGMKFINLLPKESDWHYAGKRVSFGAVDTPIFWYRPKDGKKYRVVYADFSVRDAETPPNVPYVLPEQDLIDTFREYSELSGGALPTKLDLLSLLQNVSVRLVEKFPPEKEQKVNVKARQEMEKIASKFQSGLTFVGSLPPEAHAHYAGKGVSLGAADKPIFWYLPKNSKKYRVIYADLSIRDVETPPSTPVVQPEEDLIDAIRYFTELNGRTFPDLLNNEALNLLVEKKVHLVKGQEPNAKQTQELMEIGMKIFPGALFIEKLPPEADAHYAGKGVYFGSPDKPIFWYRPKDSKKYRVIYADLSVRDADVAPNVPNAQPVPGKTDPKK